MLVINTELCTGCGACLEVCPTAALYLVDSHVTVDSALCRECEACIAACPQGAITVHDHIPEAGPTRALQPRTESTVVTARSAATGVPLRARVLPVVGAAVAWGAREIVPRLVDYWLDSLHGRSTDRRIAANGPAGQSARGPQGVRYQRRRRGRGRSE